MEKLKTDAAWAVMAAVMVLAFVAVAVSLNSASDSRAKLQNRQSNDHVRQAALAQTQKDILAQQAALARQQKALRAQVKFICSTTGVLDVIVVSAADQIAENFKNGTYDNLVKRGIANAANVRAAQTTLVAYRKAHTRLATHDVRCPAE